MKVGRKYVRLRLENAGFRFATVLQISPHLGILGHASACTFRPRTLLSCLHSNLLYTSPGRHGRHSRRNLIQLAESDPAPPYESSSNDTLQHCRQPGVDSHPTTIAKSARYPRVAVLLGVSHHYYIPLLLCRSLSTIFALWWACLASYDVFEIVSSSVVNQKRSQEGDKGASIITMRLMVAQFILSYIWATTAAYLAHLFASSLMSRWLQHYSPAAVLVRLCSLSILLAYGCSQLFRTTGALEPNFESLSKCLPLWVAISVGLLIAYFFTQQDISIEQDRDDRRRRLTLRLKCLYATAGSSLFSLLVLTAVIQFGSRNVSQTWKEVTSRVLNVQNSLIRSWAGPIKEL